MRHSILGAGAAMAVAVAGRAEAGSHLWKLHELFSNADGTIQFIELKECCGGPMEIGLGDKWVRSAATGNQLTFPENLPYGTDTADKTILIATAAFAALPGAPAPDYLVPEGFFDTAGDTIEYWTYPGAPMSFGPGELPADGLHSLECQLFGASGCLEIIQTVNSPTNFAGETGTVDVGCEPADLDLSGVVDTEDLVTLILAWGEAPGHPADLDANGLVDVADLVTLILAWGPATPCGTFLVGDGTGGTITLDAVREHLGGTYRQVADIDLGGVDFAPIGSGKDPFTGTYDGGGHQIAGLVCGAINAHDVGLFGGTLGATVENLALAGVLVQGETNVGAIVGHSRGDTIRNVHVAGGTISGTFNVGGLAGYASNTTFADVSSDVDLPVPPFAGESQYFGGIAGYMAASSITAAAVTGTVSAYYGGGGIAGYASGGSTISESSSTAPVSAVRAAGGVVGVLESGSVVSFSWSSGSVSTVVLPDIETFAVNGGGVVARMTDSLVVDCTSSSDVSGQQLESLEVIHSLGGLVGRAKGASEIRRSHAGGSVEGTDKLGGLVGSVFGHLGVEDCSASGAVTASNDLSDVGGFAGFVESATIERCGATGAILASGSNAGGFIGRIATGGGDGAVVLRDVYARGVATGTDNVGGFIGVAETTDVTIVNAYASGAAISGGTAGGFAGTFPAASTASFWDVDASPQRLSCGAGPCTGVTGLGTAALQSQATYEAAGWSFYDDKTGTGVWRITEGRTYPRFWWQ